MKEIEFNNTSILSYCTSLEKQLEIINGLISNINKVIDDIYLREPSIKEILGFDVNPLDYTFSNTLRTWISSIYQSIDYFNSLIKGNVNQADILKKQKIELSLCERMQKRAMEETIELSLRLDETIAICQIFDDDYSLS